MLILEVLLRELVGAMKPVTFVHTPPGALGNQLFLPLVVLMLGLSLWSGKGLVPPGKVGFKKFYTLRGRDPPSPQSVKSFAKSPVLNQTVGLVAKDQRVLRKA